MSGKKIGYKRVSTIDQNPERQLEGLQVDKMFIDYASGTTMNRPQLDLMLEYVRDDDLVIVHSMDRLARSVKDLRKIIDDLIAKSVKVQFLKENLTFSGDDSPIANLLLMIMGAIAEFEHSIIMERLLEGIAAAKKAGKYKGTKPKLDKEKMELLKERMKLSGSKNQIAEEFGISRFTLYKYIKIIQQQEVA
jgi:DNA invertase Pin-like site-specific DNA recombinase